jgi:hypothetical protein
MQQDDSWISKGPPTGEPITVVYTAGSWIEAVVVRGLLESAGIESPALGDGNLPDLSPIFTGIEIYTLESQAAQARQLIADHLAGADDLDEVSGDVIDDDRYDDGGGDGEGD